jgi:succinate-semialdehyde dehydrogenase/glutarate-semialdehyde dehydrogenase
MTEPDGAEQKVVDRTPKGLFIGGKWRQASTGRTLEVQDPSTGARLCDVADGSVEDGIAALDAAAAAQERWAAYPPRERGELLRRAFEAIVARKEELALLMTLEMGKPIGESRTEVAYAAEFLRWFSEQSVRIDGRYGIAPTGTGRVLTMKQPVGPCLMITPWNFPMAMGARKIGPAIAAGCTMVVKPAAETPLSMLALAEILREVGLPEGVLNVVPTSDAGGVAGPLLDDPRLRKLSFTGSTDVGRRLIAQSAKQVLKVSMELGGNAPFLVFEDADVDEVVEGALMAKMRNIGEACTAANRFLVANSLAGEFAQRLGDRMAGLRIGRGTDEEVQVGPLVNEKGRRKVTDLVDDAVRRGAHVVVGAEQVEGRGYFYRPTVLGDVTPDARLLKEEIFGPVAPVTSFDSEEAAVAAANDTEFGLVAYVYTNDMRRALRVVERLHVGMVGVNQGMVSSASAPFGGVKQSGIGREGGYEGIEEYLETKYAAINL